jgi:hypothetical protein
VQGILYSFWFVPCRAVVAQKLHIEHLQSALSSLLRTGLLFITTGISWCRSVVGKIINRVVTVLTILVVFEFYCIRPMCFVFCQSMNNEITLSLTLKL